MFADCQICYKLYLSTARIFIAGVTSGSPGVPVLPKSKAVAKEKYINKRLFVIAGIAFCAFFCWGGGAAAGNNYVFRTFSPEGGFYYDGIISVAQSGDGFIWVLMDHDIFRFDGYEYKSYNEALRKIDEPLRWEYYSLLTDREGALAVRTNNGTFRYDGESDSFVKIFRYTPYYTFDGKNNGWIWENGKFGIMNGFSLFYPRSDEGVYPVTLPVSCDYGEEFYVLGNFSNLYRYDYSERVFRTYRILPHNTGAIRQAKVHGGKMWVLADNYGFYGIDLETHTVVDSIGIFAGKRIQPRCFGIDPDGNLWAGTLDGLYIIDPGTGEYEICRHSKDEPFSLPNNSVWAIQEDRLGNIWIGTYAGGLCYVNTSEPRPFEAFLPRQGQLGHAPVSSFAEDARYLWIGTEGGGLDAMDKKTGRFHYMLREPGNENSLAFNNIKSMLVDRDGRLWLGMFTGGLDCYDPATGTFTHFKSSPRDARSLLGNDLRKIVAAPDGSGIWVLYQTLQFVVSFFSFGDQKATHYYIDNQHDRYLFDIIMEDGGLLWMISGSDLYRMDTADKNIEKINIDATRHPYARTLCSDRRGNIWIGTIGNGLYRFDPQTGTCDPPRGIGNLGQPAVYSICPDDEGNLWLGTDKGLFRYSPDEEQFLLFDENDGVHGGIHYPLASFKGSGGRLYFGGTTGFTVVEPWKVTQNAYLPHVLFSQFFIDNAPARLRIHDTGEGGEPEMVLRHDEANFGFRFSADNYLIPEKNLYRYRLSGYDDRWILADASSRTAMYSKVPPGNYRFEVIAANNDGVWSQNPAVIKIRRKAAPWAGTGALILYSCAVLSVLLVIAYHYNGKRNLRLRLYKEGLEKEKQKELHESQLRFFTNISHDFRTPLSLISAAVGRLREENANEYYVRTLDSNAKRLLDLVNELMDFRTIESGNAKLKPAVEDVQRLLGVIAGDFVEYARQKRIGFDVRIDPGLPDAAAIDRGVIEKITINLLHNAFKYTREGGSVTLEVLAPGHKFVSRHGTSFTVCGDELPQRTLTIVVGDTGAGISAESIQSVFERFYKVDTAEQNFHLGTGIGLALVKSLVQLHKGCVTIYSERDAGTDMVVEIPIEPGFYTEHGYDLAGPERNATADALTPAASAVTDSGTAADPVREMLRRERKQILLAEDNEDLRRLLSESLSADYEVLEAANGSEAIGLLRGNEVDMVISDILMPEMDGIELCREVKNDIETSHIPFILMTAHAGTERQVESADSGADVYIEKPVDPALLRLLINNVFQHQQQLKRHYDRNYFADSRELARNRRDNDFLRRFVELIEQGFDGSDTDMNMGWLASEMHMSRSKFYNKVKKLTDKSPVGFIQNYRMRKAARLLAEGKLSIREIMAEIGIESQAYFTNSFKKEFGMTPTAFAATHKSP